jgi:putative flippase GtrA
MTRRVQMFLMVGGMGFLIQIGSLALLTMAAGWPYGPATAIAVQLTVLHNFFWHERWTWHDRTTARHGHGMPRRLAMYEATAGVTSIAGNLLVTAVGVEFLGFSALAANAMAVAFTSVANFLAADRWVFTGGAALVVTTVTVAVATSSVVAAAEPRPETVEAWNRHVAQTEARLDRSPDTFRSADIHCEEPRGDAIGVPGGTIHHWRGSTLIHLVTVDALLRALMYPGTPPPQEDVLQSRVLGRSGDSLRMYLKIVRRSLVTVTYDTEHQVTFQRQSSGLATSRSVSTAIAEDDGRDRGFLWRLNSYWRYVQVDNDVLVELESLSLSRNVPSILKPIAGPIINRIARESMTKTLEALRRFGESLQGGG